MRWKVWLSKSFLKITIHLTVVEIFHSKCLNECQRPIRLCHTDVRSVKWCLYAILLLLHCPVDWRHHFTVLWHFITPPTNLISSQWGMLNALYVCVCVCERGRTVQRGHAEFVKHMTIYTLDFIKRLEPGYKIDRALNITDGSYFIRVGEINNKVLEGLLMSF